MPESVRGAAPADTAQFLEAHLAAARLYKRAEENPSPSTLADHATGLLVLGHLDAAIDALAESVEDSDGVAAYWSDLAAAYLARYGQTGQASDLPRGLDAVERSIELTRLPEALFNRAFILERLNLRDAAKSAWLEYLAVDVDSPWGAEARAHVERMDGQAALAKAAAETQVLREHLVDDVLWRWAQSNTRAEGDRLLAEGRRAEQSLADASADRLATDLIKVIDDSANSRRVLVALRAAHLAYGNGRAAYKKDAYAEADRELAVAEQQARVANSPLAWLARVNRAVIRYRFNDVAGAAAQLTTILGETPDTYASVRGRSFWILGLLSALRGNGRETAAHYGSALAALRQAHETPNAAFVEMLTASQLDGVGDIEGAWSARVSAFAHTDRESPVQAAALAASEAGWPHAAGALYDIVSGMARAQQRDIVLVEAVRGRARALALAGAHEQGLSALEEARTVAGAHHEPNWDLLKAEIDLAQSECLLQRSPADAVAAATRALEYFTASKREVRLPETHLARARGYRLLGQRDRAEADLLAGINVMERSRRQLDQWRHRALMGDIVQRSGDEIVALRVEAGRVEDAFDAAERLRAWELRTSAYGDRPLAAVDDLSLRMPDDTLMAWYFAGADETYLWAIQRGHARFVRVPAGRVQLARLVRKHGVGDRDAAATLQHLLLGPIATELARSPRLVVVPDGPLHHLSFAALPGASASYLFEEHVLLFSPNATIFSDSLVAREDASVAAPSALVVGDPAFDRSAYPALTQLVESSREAAAVSELYDRHRLLIGASAVRAAIIAALPDVDLFHFAGHSVANRFTPGESRLIVAGPPDQAITATEISRLPLGKVTLVILSSCQSAVGPPTRSEGPLGLAQAFLIAGVDTVLASLTPVEDRAARQLSVEFHREFRRSGDAASALQAAQRALQRSPDPSLSAPEAWSSFVVIGAGSRHVN